MNNPVHKLSGNRHFSEDFVSSQTIKFTEPVIEIDKFYHHKENKGDLYVNRQVSVTNYCPKDIPLLVELSENDSSSEDEDWDVNEECDIGNDESGDNEKSDENTTYFVDGGNSSDEDDDSGDDESDGDGEDCSDDDVSNSESSHKTKHGAHKLPGFNYLTCMYTNADSLLNKLDKLKSKIADIEPDILAVVETHLQQSTESKNYCPDEILYIDGYTLFRKDNADEVRGGILVYVSDKIEVTEDTTMNKITADIKESLWLVLKVNSEPVLFGTYYRKGSCTAVNNTLIRDSITKSSKKFRNVIICGDFNHPTIDWKNHTVAGGPFSPAMRFYDSLLDNFLIQHVKKPTRARGSDKPSLLDLVITEDTQMQVEPSLQIHEPFGKSDHAVLTWDYLISVNGVDATEETESVQYRRNYKKGDFPKMTSMLNETCWKTLLESILMSV